MAETDLVYRGKSKDVYNITEGPHAGKYRFVFTDRATGYMENGKPVFDPGYDVVVGEIPGKGAIACRFATYFFPAAQRQGHTLALHRHGHGQRDDRGARHSPLHAGGGA